MLKLSEQQSLRIAELPDDYRVVGVDGSSPLVREPTGQILCIQQSGRMTPATRAARDRLANGHEHAALLAAGNVQAISPYTSLSG